MVAKIEVHDVGPVIDFEYTMQSPGLHILRGAQGAGKTTILRTVQLATDGRTDQQPTKRDGAKRGEAIVAGRTVRIAKQVREEGELTVDGLGDLDLTVLHNPKFADAATRDRYRIKALVRLSGVKADASLFHALLGDRESFDEVVDAAATETDDLVEMAAKIKRSVEKAALATEAQVETARANFRAKMDVVEGIDFGVEHDATKLNTALQTAVAEHAKLSQKRSDALKLIAQAERAGERRDKLRRDYAGLTKTEAVSRQQQAAANVEACIETVRELQRQLASAQAGELLAKEQLRSATDMVRAATAHEDALAEIETTIIHGRDVECPAEDAVEAASVDVHIRTEDVASGVRVRAAIEARAATDKYDIDAKDFTETATRLRKAAAATFDVLSDAIAAIPECPLRVWNDGDGNTRLVIATDRDEREPFDDLSDGERWKVIVPMCFAKNRLIVLPQAAFGELQPTNRMLLSELARKHESYILTAQVDDGELRGEQYNGKPS